MNLRIHPAAAADQKRHFEYLRRAGAGSATLQKFIDAIREAKKKIRDNPATWNLVSGSDRIRRVQVSDFRLQVFYVILPDGDLLILEFAGPGYQPRWAGRI